MNILRRFCTRTSEKKGFVLGAMGALLILSFLLSIRLGSQSLSFAEMGAAVRNGDRTDTVYRILVHVRLPRTLGAILAGSALALAGTLIQSVLNNAMASPNIIGVNAGAGFLAMLTSVLLPELTGLIPAASFVGALATALLIYLLASRAGLSRMTLVLAGITVSSMLNAGMNAITLLYPNVVVGTSGFLLGGFSGVTLSAIGRALPYLLLGFLIAGFLAVDLNVLALGEESAAGLGLPVARVRFFAILASALLAGAAVSFAGLLGFVGLLVPHMARRFVGSDNRWLMPASVLLGGSFVCLCDVLSRVLFAPYEVPVGILLDLVGGAFFLWLLLRHKRRRVYD